MGSLVKKSHLGRTTDSPARAPSCWKTIGWTSGQIGRCEVT
jgi:hypothetical protein